MKELTCYKCGGPREAYHGWCADCRRVYEKEYREKHPYKDWSEEKKHKNRCRAYANSYLKLGKIDRGPCEVPGCLEKPQMHHDNYDKPLEIRWLCKKHHREFHQKINGPALCPRCRKLPKHVRENGTTSGYCKPCSSFLSAQRQKSKRISLNPEKYLENGKYKTKWDQSGIKA